MDYGSSELDTYPSHGAYHVSRLQSVNDTKLTIANVGNVERKESGIMTQKHLDFFFDSRIENINIYDHIVTNGMEYFRASGRCVGKSLSYYLGRMIESQSDAIGFASIPAIH